MSCSKEYKKSKVNKHNERKESEAGSSGKNAFEATSLYTFSSMPWQYKNEPAEKVCRRRDELFIHFQVAADILEAMPIVPNFEDRNAMSMISKAFWFISNNCRKLSLNNRWN